jgi:hypothetical protein
MENLFFFGKTGIECNCSEPSDISKNMCKMLAFLSIFLKYHLADTPHEQKTSFSANWL